MPKREKQKGAPVKRPTKYEEKLKFGGSFDELLSLSLQGADESVKKKDTEKRAKQSE